MMKFIVHILRTNSCCFIVQGTDKSYVHKQHEAFDGHPCYVKGDRRLWEQEFGIRHYAGLVTYTVQGFLDKNKDTQQDQLFDLMHGSTNVFVQDLTRFQVNTCQQIGIT